MNSKFIAATVVAIAAMSSASAFAQNYGEVSQVIAAPTTTSTVTRTQVQAEYIQARQNGAVAVSNEAAFAPVQAGPSMVSRADVQAEASHWVIMDGSNRKVYR